MLDHVPSIDLARIVAYPHDLAESLSRVMGWYTPAEVAALLNRSDCRCPAWIGPDRQRAILACLDAAGRRHFAGTDDPDVLAALLADDLCGHLVEIDSGRALIS